MRNFRLVAAAIFLAFAPAVTCKATVNYYWDGPSGNWGVETNWTDSTFPQMPGQSAYIGLPVTVTMNISPSIDNLNLGDTQPTLLMPGGQTLTVSGSIANDGMIIVDSSGSATSSLIVSGGTQTLYGSGSVILNSQNAQLNTTGGAVLIQANGQVISGQGTINAALINYGVVNANANGQTLSLTGTNPVANYSNFQAITGGLLSISTTVNNYAGTITAANGYLSLGFGGVIEDGPVIVEGGVASVADGGTMIGSMLTSSGTSSFQASGGTANLNAVTLSNSSQFNVLATATVAVTNGITNNGTITVDSNNLTDAYLTFSGTQTLSGTGSVVLNNTEYAQLNTSGSDLLTQAAGHTISGQGTIAAVLINQGLINANVSGGTLSLATYPVTSSGTLEGTGGGLLSINTTVNYAAGGTILATSGGSVQVGAGGVINGGTVLASGGIGLIASGGTIINGTLTSTGTSNFQAIGNGSLSAGTLTGGSQLDILGGANITCSNGLTNNGLIVVDSNPGTSYASLTFAGNQMLSGTGSVILNDSTYAYIVTINGGTLTQVPGHTISGQGTLYANLINQGLINANVNGGTLSLETYPVTSSGTLEGTAGGVLSINTTANYAAGGTILATSGGFVQVGAHGVIDGGTVLASGGIGLINSGGAIINGTLTSTGTSSFQATGSGSLSAGTLTSGSQFDILAGANVTVSNGLTNNGMIVVNSNQEPNPATLTFSGNQTLSGTGQRDLELRQRQRGPTQYSSGGTLIQAFGHTISGQGTINAALINQGLVNANVNGQTLALATNAMTNARLWRPPAAACSISTGLSC